MIYCLHLDSLCTSQTTLDNEFDELQRLRIRVAELESRLGASHTEEKILKFNIDHFFAVGSPLGIFIMLREHGSLIKRDHKGAGSFLPSCVCRRIHNLHHPSDPVVSIKRLTYICTKTYHDRHIEWSH